MSRKLSKAFQSLAIVALTTLLVTHAHASYYWAKEHVGSDGGTIAPTKEVKVKIKPLALDDYQAKVHGINPKKALNDLHAEIGSIIEQDSNPKAADKWEEVGKKAKEAYDKLTANPPDRAEAKKKLFEADDKLKEAVHKKEIDQARGTEKQELLVRIVQVLDGTVEITVEMIELYDESGQLVGIDFIFGPSGAFFLPELELELGESYINGNHALFSEEGEALEYRLKKNGKSITFYIPHFSSYSYDQYDYY